MDKIMLMAQIDSMAEKLEETKTEVSNVSNAAQDALNVVIPMMQDQLVIMRGIVEHLT